MNRSRILLIFATLGLVGAGAACGGGGGGDNADTKAAEKTSDVKSIGAVSGGGAFTVTVTAKEFSFDQTEIRLAAGKATTVVLKNGGAVEHDITIENPAFAVKASATKTDQKELTIPTAGSYTFYCSVPGHRQAGMEGTVTVS